MIKILIVLFQISSQFLLMNTVQDSFLSKHFTDFIPVCDEKVSINLEDPFSLYGYMGADKLVTDLSNALKEYTVEKISISSQQVEDRFAIQSYNLSLKNSETDNMVYYKLIFFIKKIVVKVDSFDHRNNRLVFHRDPKWGVHSKFEIFGTANGLNDGWYTIIEKRGSEYRVSRRDNAGVMVEEAGSDGEAKAWKIYYLRGLSI